MHTHFSVVLLFETIDETVICRSAFAYIMKICGLLMCCTAMAAEAVGAHDSVVVEDSVVEAMLWEQVLYSCAGF